MHQRKQHAVDVPVAAFGAKLRRLREARGLTRELLAEQAGLSVNAIAALERGERQHPYPHTVEALVTALGLDAHERADLVALIPKRGAPEPTSPPVAPAIPGPPTPLLGRAADLEAIAQALVAGNVRLLTLVGPGGVGKTRLAQEIAVQVADRYADGVVWTALAAITDPQLVLPTVAASLSLREGVGQTVQQTVHAALRSKQLLLVLDNCEHVVAAAAGIAEVLRACPGVRVLATSRAPLQIRGERQYPVAPLPVPTPDLVPDVDEIAQSAAVQLFMERAQAVVPSFALTAQNAATIAAICRRLDGLPLALELGAARTKLLPPTALLARLDRVLPLLVDGARDLPQRQQTLRHTVAWSYSLLTPSEQHLFRHLAVWAGGWTLDALVVVCGGTDQEDALLHALDALLNNSLVLRRDGDDGRWALLETIRAYAREQLEASAEAAAVRERHAHYYLALAEQAGPGLKGHDQKTWLPRLEVEIDNVRTALRWAIDYGDAERIARTAWAAWQFWWWSGRLKEGRRWIEETLTRVPGMSALARARLLFVSGTYSQALADWTAARPRAEESLAVFRQLGDEEGTAYVLGTAGIVALGQKRMTEGITLLEEAVDLNLTVGDRWAASTLLSQTAPAVFAQGDLEWAQRLARRALGLAEEIGSRDGIYLALLTLATMAWTTGHHREAVRQFKQGLVLAAEVGEASYVAYCLEGLAAVWASANSEHTRPHVAQLWGAAEALLAQTDVIAYTFAHMRSLYAEAVAKTRANSDERMWNTAVLEGRAMRMEQATTAALAEVPGDYIT